MMTRISVSLAALLLAFSTSACSTLMKTEAETRTVEERHPITVDSETASLALAVPGGMAGMTAQMQAEARAFMAVYKARGHGPLTISAPVGSPNAKSAARVAAEARSLAGKEGLLGDTVVSQTYNVSAEEPAAPVLLSFTRFVATASPCGDWSHNAGTSLRNNPMPDFGCSTQNNLAAMLEDPHDLVAPRAMAPADAERRAAVFDKYRKGEPTAVKRPADEKANVSEVGQ